MTSGLDALHEYVEEQKRLAAQHKPRKAHWRELHDRRTAQLRRVVRRDRWRRRIAGVLGVFGMGRVA